jgi:putative SOS response-associated peptidase YedK
MPGVFPDYPAPVIRNAGGAEEMVLMRWGTAAEMTTASSSITALSTKLPSSCATEL